MFKDSEQLVGGSRARHPTSRLASAADASAVAEGAAEGGAASQFHCSCFFGVVVGMRLVANSLNKKPQQANHLLAPGPSNLIMAIRH